MIGGIVFASSSTVIISKKDTRGLVRSDAYVEDSPLKKCGIYLECRAIFPSHRQPLDRYMVVRVSSCSISCVQYNLDIRGITPPDILDANVG
jgi:hypothetical protein